MRILPFVQGHEEGRGLPATGNNATQEHSDGDDALPDQDDPHADPEEDDPGTGSEVEGAEEEPLLDLPSFTELILGKHASELENPRALDGQVC